MSSENGKEPEVLSIMGFVPQIGTTQLLIVLVIAVLILGPKRIPEAAKAVGEGIRGFRKSMSDDDKSDGSTQAELNKNAKAKSGKAKSKTETKAETESKTGA